VARSYYTTHSGVMFVSPGGQSEHGSEVAAAGYKWAALNVADGHGWSDWQSSTPQFLAAGMRVPIWGRVANSSVATIQGLAVQLRRPCILDIEDEFKVTSPLVFEREIRAARPAGFTRETVISTVGWLYNDVDYKPIAHRPLLLQIFATDMRRDPSELQSVTNDCLLHARAKGFSDIGVTFQTYGDAKPEWYAFWGSRARSLFSGDAVGAASAWASWSVP